MTVSHRPRNRYHARAVIDDSPEPDIDLENAPIVVEISDVLDLHLFAPREVAGLVRDYLDECRERGIGRVRIIHGKGIGNLRRTVHAVLRRHDAVVDFALADESAGGWGATIVRLR